MRKFTFLFFKLFTAVLFILLTYGALHAQVVRNYPPDGPGTVRQSAVAPPSGAASSVGMLKSASSIMATVIQTTDNENNAGTGVPDNDVDVYLYRDDWQVPIEFNVYITDPVVTTAQLSLLAYDVDWAGASWVDPERDAVYVNGNFVGYLSGTNDNWSTTTFPVNPAWLNPSGVNGGKNLVQVYVDVLEAGWAVEIDWGQFLINEQTGDVTVSKAALDKACYLPCDDVTVKVEVDADPSKNVIVETLLVNPLNQTLDQDDRTFVASTAPEEFSVTLEGISCSAEPGENYYIRIYVYEVVPGTNTKGALLAFKEVTAMVCDCQIEVEVLTKDTMVCPGTPVQLQATGALLYEWTPTTGLSDPAIANPVATPMVTTTYTVKGTIPSENLIPNPGFEAGETGFTSAYTLVTTTYDGTGGSGLYPEGTYKVTGNPFSGYPNPPVGYHKDFNKIPYKDNNQLCVNGATTSGVSVWSVTVPVIPGSDYTFNFWHVKLNHGANANLRVSFNGVDDPTPVVVSDTNYVMATRTWTAGASTHSVVIAIKDENTEQGGNDFALDEMSFIIDCAGSATDEVTITVDNEPPTFTRPKDMTIYRDADCEYDASVSITGDVTDEADNFHVGQATFVDQINDEEAPCELIITRTWSLVDSCGNRAKDQVQTITVLDKIPPVMDLTKTCVYLTEWGKWALGPQDKLNITQKVHDNCSPFEELVFTFDPMSFDCNDAGKEVNVAVTATDPCGNTASGTTYVLVLDTISPVALCKDTTVYLDKYGQAFVFQSMVTPGDDRESTPDWAKHFNDLEGGSYDNCGIAEMHLTRQLFTCADLGSPKQVTLTVVDPSGNDASCKAMITVLDTIKPVITPVANLTVTVEPGVCTSKINYPQILVKDNCGVLLERTAGLGPDGMFPLGTTTTETWNATNVGGTFSTMSFTVTLNTYNGAPTVATVADLTVNEDAAKFEVPLTGIGYGADCVAQQVVSLEMANSNTALLTVEKEYVNGAATGKLWITPLANKYGEAIITLTVKDNGGTANGGIDTTVKSFKVTVTPVNDAPVVTPIADQFVTLPNSLSVNLGAAFSDVDEGDALTHAVTLANGSPLPAWMTFNPATGMLTGTPAAANLGVVEVKVVATDKAGATAQDIFKVIVLDPAKSIINGTVLKGTTPLTGGIRVVLMVKEGTMFNAVANTTISSTGTFSFYNLANGTYLLKAEVTDPVMNPGLLHTYYTSFPSVTQATQMNITSAGTQTATITMLPVTLPAGDFVIKGKVVRKTGSPDLITQGKDPVSTPAAGIDMVLKKNGAVVANTVTAADGTYEFTKLPEGEYEVFVELPGYTQEVSQKATVNAANPLKDKINFTIWTDTNIHIITKVSDLIAGFGMKLYPNPTTGRVNIDLNWKDVREVQVTVFTIQGDQVFRKAYFTGERIVLDLSGNASGMYMIRLDGENRTEISKLVIDKR